MSQDIYEVALTHSSYAHEHGGGHNERLEFLGDAVLELCISELLYRALPSEREGVLSAVRQRLVHRELLARLACERGLDGAMRLGAGEEASRLREEVKPLSDVWEAMLGAVYLDGGLDAARQVVAATVLPHMEQALGQQDPKSKLQEWCQRTHRGQTPQYEDANRVGPDNDPLWTVDVRVDGRILGSGTARKKKDAQRAAAAAALARIDPTA